MIGKMFADARKIDNWLDAMLVKMRRRPMPDSISSCGVPNAPWQMTISRRAEMTWPQIVSMALARPSAIRIFATWRCVSRAIFDCLRRR